MRLLLDRLCVLFHQLMDCLRLPASPIATCVAPPPRGSVAPPSLSPPQLARVAAIAHNLALLCGSLYRHFHCLYFAHFALTLIVHFPAVAGAPPVRLLRLLLVAVLSELAHRARPAAQGLWGECMVREAMQLVEVDKACPGPWDPMPSVLELQGRLYALSGKGRFVRRQAADVGDDLSEETFDVEQRLKALLASRQWSEKHCELVLHTALSLRLQSAAVLLLAHLLSAFPSPAPHRHQLLCTLADGREWFVHCSDLLRDDAVVGFAAVRFMTEDCWTRGVHAARAGRWEEGERMMRLGLQLLQRSARCADRPGDGDEFDGTAAMMSEQVAVVQQRKTQHAQEKRQANKR